MNKRLPIKNSGQEQRIKGASSIERPAPNNQLMAARLDTETNEAGNALAVFTLDR